MAAQQGFGEAPYRVVEMVLLPPRFFVGDLVEMRLKLDVPKSAQIEPPQTLPESNWMTVERVDVVRGAQERAEVRILFKSFQPGTQVLPPLTVGDIVLQDLRVSTSSLLEEEPVQKIRPYTGQVSLPYTWIRVVSITVAIISAPLMLPWGAGWFIRRMRRLRQERRRRLPALRIGKALESLRVYAGRGEDRAFCIEFSRHLREYLQTRLHVAARTSTTREIAALLRSALEQHEGASDFVRLLQQSDAIKFGGSVSGVQEMLSMIEDTTDAIDRAEKRQAVVES